MRSNFLAIVVTLTAAFLLGMAACGVHHGARPINTGGDEGSPARILPGMNLQDTLKELDSLQKPDGVDEKLWNELKSAYKKALIRQPTARSVSIPPTGEANRVNDLAVNNNGDGTYTFTWHYRNNGDYDQNGDIGVSDLSPLAMHFGEQVPADDIPGNSIQAVIDGSGNGIVDIADITPIAQNAWSKVVNYSIECSENPLAEFSVVNDCPCVLPGGVKTERAQLECTITPGQLGYFRIVPRDYLHYPGATGNVVGVWETWSVGDITCYGERVPLAIINGGLAVSYFKWHDLYYGDLMYSRADGLDGKTWNPAITVDSGGCRGLGSSLAVVNGNPAIAYRSENEVLYVRANDPNGETWGNPVTIDRYESAFISTNLVVVNGNPAICFSVFYEGTPSVSSLVYTRAQDLNGNTWGEPIVLDTGASSYSMSVINGRPAVAYDSYGMHRYLKFIYSADPNGDVWEAPATVDDGELDTTQYFSISLRCIQGKPAFSYIKVTGGGDVCKYVAASDGDGANWDEPISVNDYADSLAPTFLEVVLGKPVVAFAGISQEFGNDFCTLSYAQALDPDGMIWGEAGMVDYDIGFVTDISMLVIDDKPLISYTTTNTNQAPPYIRKMATLRQYP